MYRCETRWESNSPPKKVISEEILSGSKGRREGASEKRDRKEQELSEAAEKERMERG